MNAKHFSVTSATNSSLWVCQCGYEKSYIFGPAIRDHFLIHYIVSGCVKYKIGDVTYNLKAGDGFLIPPNEITSYSSDDDEPWEYYWVGFKGLDAVHILNRSSLNVENPTFTCHDIENIANIFTKMLDDSNEFKIHEYSNLGYLYLILADLRSHSASKTPLAENASLYLRSAIDYIDNNYSYGITISKLAKYIGIDRTYLYRIFMNELKISPEKYLMKVRMVKASILLTTTTLSVVQVAISIGYKDSAQFSKNFKQFYGVSPRAYTK